MKQAHNTIRKFKESNAGNPQWLEEIVAPEVVAKEPPRAQEGGVGDGTTAQTEEAAEVAERMPAAPAASLLPAASSEPAVRAEEAPAADASPAADAEEPEESVDGDGGGPGSDATRAVAADAAAALASGQQAKELEMLATDGANAETLLAAPKAPQ